MLFTLIFIKKKRVNSSFGSFIFRRVLPSVCRFSLLAKTMLCFSKNTRSFTSLAVSTRSPSRQYSAWHLGCTLFFCFTLAKVDALSCLYAIIIIICHFLASQFRSFLSNYSLPVRSAFLFLFAAAINNCVRPHSVCVCVCVDHNILIYFCIFLSSFFAIDYTFLISIYRLLTLESEFLAILKKLA